MDIDMFVPSVKGLEVILLFAIYGLSEATMDNIAHGKIKWFGDWTSKYKKPFVKGSHWYYFGLYKPRYKERFPFSTSILVCLTDGWHLMKFIKNLSIYLCIGVLGGSTIMIYAILMRGLLFNIFYNNTSQE